MLQKLQKRGLCRTVHLSYVHYSCALLSAPVQGVEAGVEGAVCLYYMRESVLFIGTQFSNLYTAVE